VKCEKNTLEVEVEGKPMVKENSFLKEKEIKTGLQFFYR